MRKQLTGDEHKLKKKGQFKSDQLISLTFSDMVEGEEENFAILEALIRLFRHFLQHSMLVAA